MIIAIDAKKCTQFKDLKVKPVTMEQLWENIGKTCQDIGLTNDYGE
jgi:hypothetical protein